MQNAALHLFYPGCEFHPPRFYCGALGAGGVPSGISWPGDGGVPPVVCTGGVGGFCHSSSAAGVRFSMCLRNVVIVQICWSLSTLPQAGIPVQRMPCLRTRRTCLKERTSTSSSTASAGQECPPGEVC